MTYVQWRKWEFICLKELIMLEKSLHQWCFLLRASSMMPDIKTFFWPWKISMMNEKQLWNVEKVRQWWVVVDFYWVFQYLWNLQVCFKRFMTGSKLSGQFWLSSMYSASWSHIFNFSYTNTWFGFEKARKMAFIDN